MIFKLAMFVTWVTVTNAGPQIPPFGLLSNNLQSQFQPQGYNAPAQYNLGYSVNDAQSGNSFGQQELRDGDSTQGSYSVLLPDGRTQKVTYSVNGDSGFVADVTYEGEARFDPPQDVVSRSQISPLQATSFSLLSQPFQQQSSSQPQVFRSRLQPFQQQLSSFQPQAFRTPFQQQLSSFQPLGFESRLQPFQRQQSPFLPQVFMPQLLPFQQQSAIPSQELGSRLLPFQQQQTSLQPPGYSTRQPLFQQPLSPYQP